MWPAPAPVAVAESSSPDSTYSPCSHRPSVQSPAEASLPDRRGLNRCMNIFFERHFLGNFCSFVYRPDLEDPSAPLPFLTVAIVCLCSRYLTPAEATEDFGLPSGAEVCCRFTPIARGMARSSSDEPSGECMHTYIHSFILGDRCRLRSPPRSHIYSVPTIQANLVLALSEFLGNAGSRHWMYAGTAIRMAQIMRLNKEYHQAHTLKEQEIRRRTFWACLLFDKLLACFLSKPPTISLVNVAVALPGTDASLAYQEVTRGLTLDNLVSFTGYPSEIGIMPYFIKTVCLWSNIVDFNVCNRRFVEKKPPTDPTSSFYQRHQEIQDWVASLPPGLLWSTENYRSHSALGHGREFIAMHCVIYSSFCVAHQQYLPQLDGSSILLDSVDAAGWSLLRREPILLLTCVTNALRVGEVITRLSEADARSRSELQCVWVAASVLSVSNILLWIQYANDPEYGNVEMVDRAQKYFSLFLTMLSSWSTHWAAAQTWLDILKKMHAMYKGAYLGEFDRSVLDEPSATSAVEEEDPTGFRPQPGDGYLSSAQVQNLYTCLRFLTLDTTAKPKMLQSVWMGFASGWTHDLTEVAHDVTFG